jgi:MYXO-CTERM domain-containing protein
VSPDWTGSPHHVAAGAALALGTYLVARRRRIRPGWAAALALVVTMAAQAMVDFLEYVLRFSGDAVAANYYDTIADIGSALAGAVLGAVLGLLWTALRRSQR